jgi:hypothetical protein
MWYTVLYHHTMYVISLSHFFTDGDDSWKSNFDDDKKRFRFLGSLLLFIIFFFCNTFFIRSLLCKLNSICFIRWKILYSLVLKVVTNGIIHTMYVISLSNISIKTNFKQIARVELKCVQYSEGDYILCMTSRYFFRSFTNVRLLCFVSLYTFSFEISESRLSDTRCCITSVVMKEWRDVARDVLCRTTLTWLHTIGMRDKTQ